MFDHLLPERLKTALCGLLKRCGPSFLRARIWDREFDSGQWDYLDSTKDDYIYGYLKNYAADGRILDMGCGSGNTGTELAYDSYSAYDGVDISTLAVRRAEKRSEMEGRQRKNQYIVGDILTFTTMRCTISYSFESPCIIFQPEKL
ncbi:MAG: methyltransferase domain-containing protein [Deltaproteobacteria bacterium]|nr:methyltransferase domain-containing protein [Deltaproteobacteria bacterium]